VKLLAIEAATSSGGAALFSDGVLSGERQWLERGPQTARLLPAVLDLLSECGTSFDELDLLACGTGPGRFTSIRVAVSTAQGIALAHDLKVVPVSTLAALAQPLVERETPVLAALDARRGQVYAAVYEPDELGMPVATIAEKAYDPAALARMIPRRIRLTGDGIDAYSDTFETPDRIRAAENLWYPQAAGVGRIALGRPYQAVDPARLIPRYLRPSAAEVNRET